MGEADFGEVKKVENTPLRAEQKYGIICGNSIWSGLTTDCPTGKEGIKEHKNA